MPRMPVHLLLVLLAASVSVRAAEPADADENPAESPLLAPADALDGIVVPDDLAIDLVLAEPTVRQPLFINWDERGRMWVVQYIQYPYPAGLKMLSRDEYWRAVYDKTPPAPPNHFRGADVITIHEDTDGDGSYDHHKTFLEGMNIVTSCVKGRGGVWVLNPPYLLFYPDADNDDVPDGDPVVHLEGFGLEDTHSVVNSLRWGPDGWLYASQGSTVTGNIVRPGMDKTGVHSMGQLIWRYHPESKRYEIFAEGGGNAFSVEFDAKGRIYSGTNGGDARGYHYVQGGYFRKAFTKHGSLSNPFAFDYFPAMKHHEVPRFTHNFVIYEGGALPDDRRGRLYGVEPLQGQIVEADISPHGSTFQTKDLSRPIRTDDVRFRPVEIKVGPDGAIYVADMYEPQISHREHFQGRVDKANGRIYRLKQKDAEPPEPFDLSTKSSRELVALLEHPNKWHRQTALRLLGDRRDASIIPLLEKQFRESTGQKALESLWALNLSGGFDEETALATLDHADPYVRLWTVRLLGDKRQVSPAIAEKLRLLASTEPNVEVRSQLACSAKRLPAADALPIARQLVTRSEDLDDPHMPLLIWWVLEDKAGSDPGAVVELFEERALWDLPLVKTHLLENVMRRFAQSGTRQELLLCARLLELSPGDEDDAKLLAGFEKAFQGRSLAGLPQPLVAALARSGGGSLVLGVRQNRQESIEQALATIVDSSTDRSERLQLVQVFGEVDIPGSVSVLLEIFRTTDDDELQMASLTSLQRYSEERIGAAVLENLSTLSDDVRVSAINLLTSRPVWSRQLLAAVDAGRVAADTIPLDALRKMTIHRDQSIADGIAKHWSDLEGASTAQMQEQIARLGDVVRNSDGDPYRGKELYAKTCAKCHILYGEGGRIGPDLTTFKRDDYVNILINVVNPSAEVREGFESFLVLTDEGRTASGFLFDQDNQVVVLRGTDGQNVTIPRDRIEEMMQQRKSLMPEGLLDDMSDAEVSDLFAYLRTSQPLNN